MKKDKIFVYNYMQDGRLPEKLEVEAFCVGGNEGIYAFFNHPENHNLVVCCDGDDGHWWVTRIINKYWLKGFLMALTEVQNE